MGKGPKSVNPYYNPVLYFCGVQVTRFLAGVFWRRRIRGLENIPPRGQGVIFAANHRSLADPNLVGSVIPYPIHYFAKDELFHVPVIGWYIRRVNSFPVKRGAHDISSFKTAIRVLEAGECLLLFPEGGRREGDRQWKAKPGVGMLACKTGARVIPVLVKNSDHLAQFKPLSVIFGKPLTPPADGEREVYQQFSDTIMQKIKELNDEPA